MLDAVKLIKNLVVAFGWRIVISNDVERRSPTTGSANTRMEYKPTGSFRSQRT